MMKRKLLHIIPLLAMIVIAACGKFDYINESVLENMSFPSTGSSPEGNDVISATTNQSGKEDDLAPKLNGIAGAGFVRPPQINNYGTVNLSYAFETPPGRAGMQPEVGLSYSSSGGDGLAGIGWSLSTGLGVISRTTRHGQLYYDRRDEFTFNGKRLIKVSGPPDSENGTYRLEIESGFSRFELSDAESGGVWKVYDKAGTVTIFGEDLPHRIYHPDNEYKTYIWNFSRSYDLNGNYMYAVYDDSDYEEDHILYLEEIRYTGNIRENTAARQYVRFTYEKRDESYVSKAPGFIMKMDRILDEIIMGWDEGELWRYRMVYETSAVSSRPLLKTVDSDRTSTGPEFKYKQDPDYFVWNNVENPRYSDPEVNPDATQYFEGDFNGDGISDMVFFNPETGTWRAAESKPSGGYLFKLYGTRFKGYSGPDEIQWFKGNVTGDYNGDGRSDIAFYLPREKEFWVAEHTGRYFIFRRYEGITLDIDIFKCEWFSGDFDGNGLSDAVLYNEPTGQWILMKNNGGKFEFINLEKRFQNLFRDDFSPDAYLNSKDTLDDSEYGRHREKVHFLGGDYNGDGRTDISIYDSRSGKWYVGENYRIDDYPGFEYRWYLYKEFTAPEQTLFMHDRFSGDFNGDGLSDFLLFDRSEGTWWIGETGDRSINFREYSKAPQFREVTRWLQGDFNGDGRTDIGFYSKTDDNFWIGEATPSGFRYIIYNNLNYCPDAERILAAPLPRDEVVITDSRALYPFSASKSIAAEYQHDANYYENSGEMVFAGNFTGSAVAAPEFLIYKRRSNEFYFKRGEADLKRVLSGYDIDLESDGIRLLNNGMAGAFTGNHGVMFYRNSSSLFGGAGHSFSCIRHDGDDFVLQSVADFDDTAVTDFSGDESYYLVDNFIAGDPDKRVLVIDDMAATPGFVLFSDPDSPERLSITGDLTDGYFRYLRNKKQYCRIFSGKFTSTEKAQVLVADMTANSHRWYLGTIEGGSVSFKALEGSPHLYLKDLQNRLRYHVQNGFLIYAVLIDGRHAFYRLRISGISDGIDQTAYQPLPRGTIFRNEYGHDGNPAVYDEDRVMKVVLKDTGYVTEDYAADELEAFKIARPDLLTEDYPFRWIQGDYNGDGKTDIGFFHLKERHWYFSLSGGTAPDMINLVRNGIGGKYEMEYANSSSYDNTGDDSILDLPMNYKVCTALTVDDGLGRQVITRYSYEGGYAFSDFINGYKETDYFGFGIFKTMMSDGSRTESRYHNVPYADFLLNRALSGAVKETRFIGSNNVEYNRTEYEYKLHEIRETGAKRSSYLVEPVQVRKYVRDVLTETRESEIVLVADKYEMVSKTESVTDHYSDGLHQPVTLSAYSEFENIEDTNEMRLIINKKLTGTTHETTTTYEYDDRGNLTRQTAAYTGTGLPAVEERTVEHEYDEYGNRVRTSDTSGDPARVTGRSFDGELHQFVTEDRAVADGITLATGYEINYGSAFGGITKKTDPAGNSVYFDYDELGRLLRQRADADSGVQTVNSYTYDTAFPMSGKVTRYTGTGGSMESRAYIDGAGRTIHAVSTATDHAGKRYVKTGKLVYDKLGRLIRKSQVSWAGDDEIDTYYENTDEKNPTVTEYDGSGRVKKITLPPAYAGEDETSTTFTYNDPWETVSYHSVGRSKRAVKNARGQVLYIEDSGTGDDGLTVNAKIGFAYDIAGNRVKKMDLNNATMTLDVPPELFQPGMRDGSGNNIAVWRFDAFGQLRESSDPDLGYSGLGYNAFGDVTSRTDGLDRTTAMAYDGLGRLTEKVLPGSEGSVSFIYDTLEWSDNSLGRLVAIDDPAQRKDFSYDRIGRVKREKRVIKAATQADVEYVTDFEYDLPGRKTKITYPTDPGSNTRAIALYEYCAMGTVSIVLKNELFTKNIVKDVSFNEYGQMTRVERGNGTVTNYDYDIKGRLDRLKTTADHNDQTWNLQDVSYQFKTDNSIRAVENSPTVDVDGAYSSTVRYEYSYDGLNRLVEARGEYEKTGDTTTDPLDPSSTDNTISKKFLRGYAYSANGNLTGKTIYDPETGSTEDAWSYVYSNHAATAINTTKSGSRFIMGYDAVGNMTAQRDNEKNVAKEMMYDSYNRIKQVTDGDTGNIKGQYWYDDQGFRVRKLAGRELELEESSRTGLVEVLYPSIYFCVENFKGGDYDEEIMSGFMVTAKSHDPCRHRYRHRKCDCDDGDITTYQSAVNNVYLNGIRIAAALPDGTARYYLTDQVDSVKVVVDDEGFALSKYEYLPYGETWFQEDAVGYEDQYAPKYNSQELDKESGYYFYNARHYDAEISRFITPDTVIDGQGDTQGWNRFSYVKGNPVRYRDPTGHDMMEGAQWTPQKEPEKYDPSLPTGIDVSPNLSKKDIENYLQKARDKNIIIISTFRGGGRENVGETFRDAAETRAEELKALGYKNVSVYHIDSVREFQEILDRGNIDHLEIFGHASPERLVIGSGEGPNEREYLYASDLTRLNRNAFNKGATIKLNQCKTASEEKLPFSYKLRGINSIAEEMAKYFKGVSVTGNVGGATAVPSPNAEIDYNFNHRTGDKVWFKTKGEQRTFYYGEKTED